jgi:hypothetical protein
MHETLVRAEQLESTSNRKFGLVFTVFCVLVAGYGYWRGAAAWAYWAGAASVFALAALLWPRALTPLNWFWTRLGLALSKITTPVVMALLFFGTVVPTGLVMRLLGKDPLRLRRDRTAASYWIERSPPGPAAQSFKDQF